VRPRQTAAVAAALESGAPVVALESSVLSQGLLPPFNREAAGQMIRAVTNTGAVPVITAVVKGQPSLGLEPEDLERFLAQGNIRKLSARDLAMAMADGADGATTVAGTLAICAIAGLDVVATGGIGGVHRDAAFDESADLVELSRTRVIVVCAGASRYSTCPLRSSGWKLSVALSSAYTPASCRVSSQPQQDSRCRPGPMT